MKQTYTVGNIIVLMVLSLSCFGQKSVASGFDVRSVRWWMSKAQVIAAEKRKPNEQTLERLLFNYVKVGEDYANLP